MSCRVVIHGAKGRMGHALLACATDVEGLDVVAGVDLGEDLGAALANADCVIDFTHANATADLVKTCRDAGKHLVIGTTGQEESTRTLIRDASNSVPIVFAPNFSVGVNTLFWLTREACRILGPEFDLEVLEMHHRLKKDAPSGTARRLAEILAEGRGLDYENDVMHGREGMPGERTGSEIGMHSIRGGDVVGDHTVVFANVGERVELTHKASSRDTFARGALRAALWVADKPPGLYDMEDVLGLRARS